MRFLGEAMVCREILQPGFLIPRLKQLPPRSLYHEFDRAASKRKLAGTPPARMTRLKP